GQVLLDESVLGWGEFELEVMRDGADNVVIVCSIENVDPMGVHTGDSVTVAPQQTLTDHLYQRVRDQAIAVIRAVGVETGGSNVQFAVDPRSEEILVIEMNPRVSRSSALASKATGFPIAKIAARLAVGYRLDEIDKPPCLSESSDETLLDGLRTPGPSRFETVLELLGRGVSVEAVHERTRIDPWFLAELRALAHNGGERAFAGERSFRAVDTCAAEFPARTPYYYSGWERPAAPGAPAHEVRRGQRESVVILGSGPNRIGQGIEFD